MAQLVLGPLLRYVSENEATVWVETDAACEVAVLDHAARTFQVEAHHYALVKIEGLSPGTATEYEVSLDGERVWPPPEHDFPRARSARSPRTDLCAIAFGSCRVAYPQRPPYSLPKDEHPRAARWTRSTRSPGACGASRPRPGRTSMLLLGDQVYADEVSPEAREFIRDAARPRRAARRRGRRLRGVRPSLPRGLGATPRGALAALDRVERDDLRRPRRARRLEHVATPGSRRCARKPWWDERIVGALHVVLDLPAHRQPRAAAPRATTRCTTACALRREDAGPMLREFAARPTARSTGTRWSYCRDLGGTRLVDDGLARGPRARARPARHARRRRVGVDRGARDAATSTTCCSAPRCRCLLAPAMHYLEAWNEAVCEGAWGEPAAGSGEDPPGARPRALGRVRALVRAISRGWSQRRRGRARAAARHDRRAVRRRSPRLPDGGRLPPRGRRAQRRLPGRVLAVPQPARPARARGDQGGRLAPGRASPRTRSRAAPACASPTCAGGWPAGASRGSTTRWAPSSCTAAGRG